MGRQALMARRVHATGSRKVAARISRELWEPSDEGAQSFRVQRRLRSERGQAAVEFALVIPFICLIIIAILHFGKVMNYWLDLNQVASEGARKAAVNMFASDADADTYLRDRLETTELRTGGTASIPTAAVVRVCAPEGTGVGDPVTVQVEVPYSIPYVGATVTLRGTATMRLEQELDYVPGGACV
jgi:Flp pilus assembly protein TadG